MLVLELDADGQCGEVTRMIGDEVFGVYRPFTVRVVPTDLLGRLWRRPL